MRTLSVIFLFLASVAAQTPATGSISGRIVDIETGAPLAGVSVGSQSIGRASTDADGRYILRNLAPGTVSVFVREMNGGYTNMTLNAPKRVTVTAGRETTNVNFRVRMDAQISGRVFDENDEPLPGISVSVVEHVYTGDEYSYSRGGIAPRILRTVVTDDRGAYIFDDNVFSGRQYYLLAQSPKRYTSPVSDLPINPEGRRRTLVPSFHPSAATLESAVPINLKSLEHRTNVDIRMRRAANYCVSGILNAGTVPARMRFAVQDELIPSQAIPANGVPPLGGESGDDGKIRVCDLYPGQFRLIAAQPTTTSDTPFSVDFTPFSVSTPIAILNSDISGLNIVTAPPISVAGEIVWDRTPADASLKPSLRIVPSPLLGLRMSSLPQTTLPGEFSLTMLPSLEYSLSLAFAQPGTPRTMPANLHVKDITYGGSSVIYGAIRPGDSAARLRIVMSDEAGSIGVTAMRADGTTAVGSAVLILPAATQTDAEFAARTRAGHADDTGSYRISNVPPGRYFVLATDDSPIGQTNLPSLRLEIARTPETLSLLKRVRARGQSVDLNPRGAAQVRVTPQALE